MDQVAMTMGNATAKYPASILKKTATIVTTFRMFGDMALPKALKRKLFRAYLGTFVFRRYDAIRRCASVVDYQVHFLDYRTLSFLFKEIFLKQDYAFRTETRAPFIVDCGSNIGMSVLYFKMLYPDAEIVAFEPDADAFACLSKNIEVNQLRSVHAYNLALHDHEGEISFFYSKAPGCLKMSTRKERMPEHKRTVPCTVLSKHLDRTVDFLKVDVEGSEQAILEELRDAGALARIREMVIEYHHHIVPDEDELSRMLVLLEQAGFGYQIEANLVRRYPARQFQNILIHAYRKNRAT